MTVFFFFFSSRRRHTRYWRDWSSDVCSSDLDAPISVIAADLDHFKLVNDRHGHRAGDEVLKAFADTALTTKRLTDDIGRIGGEEFALILPDTDEHGALILAERIRQRVRDKQDITVSFGIATFPNHGCDPEHVLHKADQALYLAKQLGRDRSVIYSDD